jgi:Tfp pilus assembly protein PilF
MKCLFAFLLICVGLSNIAVAQTHHIQSIVELLNQGEIVAAQTLLQANVEDDSQDIDSRLLLGTVNDFLGETDEAIRIWSGGLQGNEDDYAFYMSIGELRLRQGTQGSQYRYVRGVLQPVSEVDSLENQRFKIQQLNLAVAAFQKATDFYPYESDAWENLAASYQELNQPEMALSCWLHLNEVFPQHDNLKLKLGLCRLKMGHLLEARKAFEAALDLNPRLYAAHAGLAEYWLEKDDVLAAELAIQKSEFYKWLPPFINLAYTKDRYEKFEKLAHNTDTENVENIGEKEEKELWGNENITQSLQIDELLKDGSTESTDFLAAVLWYDEEHITRSSVLFDALATRGLAGARLLSELAKNSENVHIISQAVQRLVKLKVPGTFDLLVSLLPQDKQPFQHINIADYMAQLGDDRAMLYLIKELNPTMINQHQKARDLESFSLIQGIQASRQRAALALSAFNHPAAILALEEGLKNENVNVYCSASLYKITKEDKYLTLVENFTETQRKDKLLVQFFSHINTKEASKLMKKLNNQ